jgi:tetratricopeptide (TPR) repeat protein
MFFMRLRRGAKWVFVLLVLAFAFGFLFQGVGGGGGGDIISQLLGMRGTNPIKSGEKAVKQHPNNASDWNSLALLYQGKLRYGDAIGAYEHYLKLKPNDLLGLSELAAVWKTVASQRWNDYSAIQQDVQSVSNPLGSTGDPVQNLTGANQLLTTYSNDVSAKAGAAYSFYLKAAKAWEGVEVRSLQATPKSDKLGLAQAELQLGDAAANANDLKLTIKSYKTYLRLVPGSKLAPQVRKALAAAVKANGGG